MLFAAVRLVSSTNAKNIHTAPRPKYACIYDWEVATSRPADPNKHMSRLGAKRLSCLYGIAVPDDGCAWADRRREYYDSENENECIGRRAYTEI